MDDAKSNPYLDDSNQKVHQEYAGCGMGMIIDDDDGYFSLWIPCFALAFGV
jgi:hypothetical protein